MRRVVSNTGPLLHLHEAQALALLNKVGAVHIPRAVDTEIAQHIPDWQTQRPERLLVSPLTTSHAVDATACGATTSS